MYESRFYLKTQVLNIKLCLRSILFLYKIVHVKQVCHLCRGFPLSAYCFLMYSNGRRRFLSEFFDFALLIISPLLHGHLSPPHEVCDNPDQAEHFHTLCPNFIISTLTWHLAGFGVCLKHTSANKYNRRVLLNELQNFQTHNPSR